MHDMKVEATQTVPVSVNINDDEIYRIFKHEILRLYGLPEGAEVRDGILYKVWMEDFSPYDPEEMKEEIRKATDDDMHACHVLEKLQADYKGWEYAK